MATVVNQLPEEPVAKPPVVPWPALAWFTVLVIAVYFPILERLVAQWSTDEDVGHGFFVPLVSAFIAWQRRDRILNLDLKPGWGLGLALMIWGALQAYLGMLGAELFLQRSAILVTLTGILLLAGGRKLVRVLAFPLCLLIFMIPIPTVVYNQLTFPLQLFASRVAEAALGLLGVPVLRDGNILELPSQRLSVAEACSGIRSLLSLSFLALVYAYFFDSRVWMRWALLIGMVPVAIAANAGRVTMTGILSEYNADLAHGFFHLLEGWIIFIIALAMMFVLHKVLERITRAKAALAGA